MRPFSLTPFIWILVLTVAGRVEDASDLAYRLPQQVRQTLRQTPFLAEPGDGRSPNSGLLGLCAEVLPPCSAASIQCCLHAVSVPHSHPQEARLEDRMSLASPEKVKGGGEGSIILSILGLSQFP